MQVIKKEPLTNEHYALIPLEQTRKRINDARIAMRNKKADELIKHYQLRLQEYIKLYFESMCDEQDENEKVFDILNAEWKDLCNKVNTTQKLVHIGHEAFEKNIELILKNKAEKELEKRNQIQDNLNSI